MFQESSFRVSALALTTTLVTGCLLPVVAETVSPSTDFAPTSAAVNKDLDNTTTSPPKLLLKPGVPLSSNTDTEDLVATYDVDLAKRQAAAYIDSPEAAFILAVALSRTSHVEEALQQVRRARKLAQTKGGPAYFDKMISTYEEMLKNFPEENQVRYGLAWAYYMKAYLLAKRSRSANPAPAQAPVPKAFDLSSLVASSGALNDVHIQGALERADSSQVPEIRKYYEGALQKLDELLVKEPNDIWAKVYRAFLKAEYTGNLPEAMETWKACQAESPDNPAPCFFLGEGYLRQGNLKECFANISRAISLRATGK